MKLVRNNSIEILILTISFVAYYFWRLGEPFVWDDTNLIKDFVHLHDNKDYKFYILHSFLHEQDRGYRPLSLIIQYLNRPIDNSVYPLITDILIPALLLSVFNFFLYKLTILLGAEKSFSLLFVTFLNFNLVVLQGNWIISAGYPILVPMLTVISIYYFLKLGNNFRLRFIIPYILSFIFGSLYREIYFVVPLMLILYQLINFKDFSYQFLILNFILLMNSIFPQYLASNVARMIVFIIDISDYQLDILLGKYHSLEFSSIFHMGDAGKRLSEVSKFYNFFKSMLYFIPIFPSILLIFTNATIVSYFIDRDFLNKKFMFFFITFTLCFLYLYYLFCVLTLLIIIIYSLLNKRLLITLWFLLFFIPVSIVFTEKIHFAYSVIPFTLLVTLIILDIYRHEFKKC